MEHIEDKATEVVQPIIRVMVVMQEAVVLVMLLAETAVPALSSSDTEQTEPMGYLRYLLEAQSPLPVNTPYIPLQQAALSLV